MSTLIAHSYISAARPAGVIATFVAAIAIWRQRRALAELDATARRDLGLSIAEVHVEASRPLWDLPQNARY